MEQDSMSGSIEEDDEDKRKKAKSMITYSIFFQNRDHGESTTFVIHSMHVAECKKVWHLPQIQRTSQQKSPKAKKRDPNGKPPEYKQPTNPSISQSDLQYMKLLYDELKMKLKRGRINH